MPWFLLATRLLAETPLEVADGGPTISETQVLIADTRIDESSGLAASIRHKDILWTLNDSGGEPCVFALDARTGATRAKVRLPNAANLDWEDMAAGPGVDGKPALFIADIGDNLEVRPTIQIYEIPEPDVGPPGTVDPDETWSAPPRLFHAAYPDRPHNAEGIAVHPTTRQIYLITKSDTGHTPIFAMPTDASPEVTSVLKEVAELTFPAEARLGKRPRDNTMATAADISPDGRRLLIATYSHIYEWDLSPNTPLQSDLAKPARKLSPSVSRQMEAVCYDADGQTLWFTSEQLPAPLVRVDRD